MTQRLLIVASPRIYLARVRLICQRRWANFAPSVFARMSSHSNVPTEGVDDRLYRHTSYRWIYNENLRQAERYFEFNVKGLKAVTARAINRREEDVVSIQKLAEGGHNRTFTLTMQDGLELIARMPYPKTVPKKYATASEVATMDFVRLHGVPVPQVYDYSITSQNCVGAEYMIMEKVGGKLLWEYWDVLTPQGRNKIIEQIVNMEATLFSINFPASGSIYYKKDLDTHVKTAEILGPDGSADFCVGPSADAKWWYQERAEMAFDRGPYTDSQETLKAVGKKELAWMNQYAQPRFPADVILREMFEYKKIPPDDQVNTLENYLQLSSWLVPKEANINRFVLRHPDLQPGNLFVSDSMDLLGIIDWQHSSILPIFLHCGIPHHFQNYGDRDSMELNMPELPDNFSELSSEDREAANELLRRRELHFLYIAHTKESNEDHMDALGAPYSLLRKRLYHYAAVPWDGNSVYLKVDLIRVYQLWEKITAPQGGIAVECPIDYSATEIKECFRLESELLEMEESLKKMRENLAMDDEGGVATEYYDAIKAHVQKVKADCVSEAETDLEKKAILYHYPFDDHDESGIT